MEWIKRNLLFVIGAVVALVLMGLAFFYLFTKYSENATAKDELGSKYEELKRVNTSNSGNDKVDNIKSARQQQAQLSNFVQKASIYFQPVPPIPDVGTNEVTGEEFKRSLDNTMAQLWREAANASVTLTTNYYFTFEAQKPLVRFAKDSLRPLSVQLGEIKTICDVLFAARVNALDGIRRQRVSSDDREGYTDYHEKKTITNDLATATQYEVTFRCFSKELGDALAGFANLPQPILVKSLNVEPAASSGAITSDLSGGAVTASMRGAEEERMMFARRYGLAKGPPPVAPAPAPGTRPVGRGGLVQVISENPVKVTLWLDVIKPKSGTK